MELNPGCPAPVSALLPAMAAALAEMVSEGEVTETKALEIARGYFHDNTAKLFGLPTLPVRDATLAEFGTHPTLRFGLS